MASGENVLWVVEAHAPNYTRVKYRVFRTRAAANKFVKEKQSRKSRMIYYSPFRATWGPEQ